jgi:hypothetical protein
MGATFYLVGFLLVVVLLGIAGWLYVQKNHDRIANYLLDQACYLSAKNRGYIKPGEYESDRRALDYAIKHNKKTTWITID